MLIWDAGIVGCGITCYTMILVPDLIFFFFKLRAAFGLVVKALVDTSLSHIGLRLHAQLYLLTADSR